MSPNRIACTSLGVYPAGSNGRPRKIPNRFPKWNRWFCTGTHMPCCATCNAPASTGRASANDPNATSPTVRPIRSTSANVDSDSSVVTIPPNGPFKYTATPPRAASTVSRSAHGKSDETTSLSDPNASG